MALSTGDVLTQPTTGIGEQAHAEATQVTVAEATRTLGRILTDRLLAYVVNVRDVKTLARWESAGVREIRVANEQRLRVAYEIAILLGRMEGASTVRAWFIGMDPYLSDASPADALHDGQLREALNAARGFMAYGGMGG
ncbi:MAG: XRE family transcriptional regulator [Chloroflexota bacterium]|nr:XRE family transcriptional regulator [Chloroflexota bacterium]